MNIALEKGEKRGSGRSAEPPLWSLPPAKANLQGRRSRKGEREAPGHTRSRLSPLFFPPPPRPALLPSPAGSRAARPPAADWKFLAQAAARPIGVGFPHFMRASKMALGSRGGNRGREALAGLEQQRGGDSYPS